MLLKQGTRKGNRGKCMGKQKGEGETTKRMGNEVTDRARAKVGSHFSFSHFRVRSLFLIPRFSSILACGHRRISGLSTRVERPEIRLCPQASSIQGHLLSFRKVLLGIWLSDKFQLFNQFPFLDSIDYRQLDHHHLASSLVHMHFLAIL